MPVRVIQIAVAVAGMALLPEALANVDVGKDPATAYAPQSRSPGVFPLPLIRAEATAADAANMRGVFVVTASPR